MDATAPEARGLARPRIVAPVALSLLAGGLATVGVRRSFTLVEVESALQSSRPWRDLVPVWHVQASDGLYLAVLKGWLHAGSSEWVARVPSIAAVACTAGLVYALGRHLFDGVTGVAGGLLFATNAYVVGIGREAQPLALATLAASLATWLFVVALRSGKTHAWAAYAVVAAASVYVHASCSLVLVAHAAMLLFGTRPTRRTTSFVVGAVALATPAVVAVLAARRHLLDPLVQPGLNDVAHAIYVVSGRNIVLVALAYAGLSPLARDAIRTEDASRLVLLTTWMAAPVVAPLTLSIARPSLDPRYLGIAMPAVSIVAGLLVVRLPRRELGVLAVTAALAVSAVRLEQLDHRTAEDWPAAVAYATTADKTGDRIVIAPQRALSAFAYYAGPGRGSLVAGGPTAFVVVRAADAPNALEAGRTAVKVPAYALRGERRFGRHLWVQEWDRTALP